MSDVGCVSEAELHAFAVGELPEGVARLITLHLEGCPNCEATARRLDSLADPFLHSLRQAVHTPSHPFGPDSATNSLAPRPTSQNSRDTFTDFACAQQNSSEPLPQAFPGYEILEELGRGGMGVVYRARQLRLGRVVALKILLSGAHASTERRARFRAEADAIARLHHPGIVQVYDVGENEGAPFLVLEFMGGGSLERRLAGKALPPRQAAEMIETLARAIDHAHGHGIVHRDLKPSNILLSEEWEEGSGEPKTSLPTNLTASAPFPRFHSPLSAPHSPLLAPKISDFGLAKQDMPELTSMGQILGTPPYMAPEQAAGATNIGPAADVYALGAILYELLTGRPPFVAASSLETLEQVRTREPIAPSRLTTGIPRDLETICLKCLEKEPGKRYGGARALADDLRRYLDGQPVLARPIGTGGRAWRWARRNPGWSAMIGSIAGLLLIGAMGATVLSVWALRAEGQTQEKLFESRISEARALTLSSAPASVSRASRCWTKPDNWRKRYGCQATGSTRSGTSPSPHSACPTFIRRKPGKGTWKGPPTWIWTTA